MGDPTATKTNSLSSLLGQYMSDSEGEEQPTQSLSEKTKSDSKIIDKKSNGTTNEQQITTFWTECLDQSTGHPYYWNIETKEVTWEKPTEYVNYLNSIKSIYALPEDSWSVGYSDDSQVPYYVNEITRVVLWEKPPNFKEKPRIALEESITQPTETNSADLSLPKIKANKILDEKKTRTDRKRSKKVLKKPLPKHLQKTDSDDEKIEVITEYVEQNDTSSGEDGSPEKKIRGAMKEPKQSLNLIAAYDTDSDSEVSAKKNSKLIETSMIAGATEFSSTTPNINTTSFASIITGGKSGDVDMDEELNKFKEELEKDLQNAAVSSNVQENVAEEQEKSFDEKTFQRKKRIEFIAKPTELGRDKSDKSGGTIVHEDSSVVGCNNTKTKPQYINFQKVHVEFESKSSPEPVVYGPKPLSPQDQLETVKTDSNMKSDHDAEISDLCDILSGKVKFLSAGKPEVSPVQIMSIQLEALQAAFRASHLDSNYFFKWLKTTSDDLQALEQNAAPEGWECKWDRDSSQYCYKNIETNEIHWEFPCESVMDDGKVDLEEADANEAEEKLDDEHDDDAMDICTTPPPPPSPPTITGGSFQWDPGNAVLQDTSRPADISGELASFYSDIASIDPTASNLVETEGIDDRQTENDDLSPAVKKAKKRKKVKVPGLASKMQEVSTMVANWQKAQKELDN